MFKVAFSKEDTLIADPNLFELQINICLKWLLLNKTHQLSTYPNLIVHQISMSKYVFKVDFSEALRLNNCFLKRV